MKGFFKTALERKYNNLGKNCDVSYVFKLTGFILKKKNTFTEYMLPKSLMIIIKLPCTTLVLQNLTGKNDSVTKK